MNMFGKIAYAFKRLGNKIRYGLLLHVLRDYLAKIGIVITPYYWVEEAVDKDYQAKHEALPDDYHFGFFGEDDIKLIATIPGRDFTEKELLKRLNDGKKCFGCKKDNEIVAFNWVVFNECAYLKEKIKLAANEAYLFDMYTLKAFRGKQIAPILRSKTYDALREDGIERFFSVSERYNSPSIRFKKKLGSRFVKSGLIIELFKKSRWHWILKENKRQPND